MMLLTSYGLYAQSGLTKLGVGSGALGTNSTHIGYYAGNSSPSSSSSNTLVGAYAGRFTQGNDNAMFGRSAGYANVGSNNAFLGTYAGMNNSGGDNNTFTGVSAGFQNTNGNGNTYSGRQAGGENTIGSNNTAIGYLAGFKGGNRNVCIGNSAGYYETGNDKLYIDNSNTTSPLIYGDFAANIVAVFGTMYSQFGYQVFSDRRYKKDIKTISNALSKINSIEGVSYKFIDEKIEDRDFSKAKDSNYLGFIAQDLKKVVPELVTTDEDGYHSVNYDGLIPVLVEGMKEQQQIITDLQTRMDKLEALLKNENSTSSEQGNTKDELNSGIVLKQNTPNPSSKLTKIEYELPNELDQASLVIYDLNGKSLAEYPISGKGMVEYDTTGLINGTYIYAINSNSKNISTRKMIIQK